MKNIIRHKKSFIFLIILVLAVGYATIASTLYLFGNVLVTTSSFDVIFVKASLNEEDITDDAIKGDKTILEYSIDNLKSLKDESSLEFFIKNQSNQYDTTATISCSAYTIDETKRVENTNLFNEYINLTTDKKEYKIKALQVENGFINIKLKKLYTGDPVSVYFRCTLIANAEERETIETNEGKIPGAYVMGMLSSSFDDGPKLLNNQTGDVISTDALDELVDVVNSNQAVDSPVGNILTIMGNHAPAHYLICDGSTYNIADYPYLAAYFEQEFGTKNHFGGDGTTTFAVPDLRGEFLRGTGTATRNSGSGSAVGTHQNPTEHNNMRVNGSKIIVPSKNAELSLTTNFDKVLQYNTGIQSVSTNFQELEKSEAMRFTSRPTNTSVLYVIKYEPTYYMVIKTK